MTEKYNIDEKQKHFEKVMNEIGIKEIKDIPYSLIKIKEDNLEFWIIV